MPFHQLSTKGDFARDDLVRLDGPPEKFPKIQDHRMSLGKPAADLWPADARIYLTDEHTGTEVPDLLGNTNSADGFEYLPFAVGDQKRKILATRCFCINPLGPVDCLDVKASKITYQKNGRVLAVPELVLDKVKAKNAKPLFRVSEAPTKYVVHGDLAKALLAASFTNLFLKELRAK